MYLSAASKHSLSEALSLVQTTVRNAETEMEEAAQEELARMRVELDQVKGERDNALKVAHTAELDSTRRETELSKAEAMNENLRREIVHWQEQAKNWQEHYTRVEQERCGLATELVALSRSALTESPPKRQVQTVPPPAIGPPSPSDSGSPQTVRANPRNPAPSTNAKEKQADNRAAHKTAVPRPAKSAPTASTSSGKAATQPPRQILLRRVHAVVHVKEEEEEGDIDMAYEDEDDELEQDSVRIVKRRRSGLMVADEEDYQSDQDARGGEDEESGDELIMVGLSSNVA
ncbi:hypothetical protein C8F01DRAFT_1113554 [Mycena amicta]|nr:hypothetical protein C8F01DRAFT_1113554 [Mycena amicta]